MANTEMTPNNPLAVSLWGKKDWIQTTRQTRFGNAFSRGTVFFPEEMIGQTAVGDNITYAFVGQLTGKGVGEGQPQFGNEEALPLGNFKMAMNETRHAVLNPAKRNIESRRTNVNFEANTRRLLRDWFGKRLDNAFFYQLAGSNPNTLTVDGATYTTASEKLQLFGHNMPVAPTSDRIIRPNAATTDEAITSTDKMSLKLIDYALELAETGDQPIEPLDDGTYDLYLHPSQMTDLRLDTTNPIQWYQIQLAMIQGGKKNALDGSMGYGSNTVSAGRYGNVNLISSPRVAIGVNSSTGAGISTVKRAVLCGKNAIAFGSPDGGRSFDETVPLNYEVELVDYNHFKGIAADLIYGMKRSVPSFGSGIGSLVLSTYGANHY